MEALAVKDIIVCGHTYCGAMKAVLDPTSLDTLPATKGWLTYVEATRRVMLVQIENLRTHPSVLMAMPASICLLRRPVTVPLSALIVFR